MGLRAACAVPYTPPSPTDLVGDGGVRSAPVDARVSRAIPASLAGASWRAFTLLPIVAGTVALLLVATAPPADRAMLFGAAIVAAVAGLSATSVGVFGAVLVPGLLLLGVPPAVAAPLSLLVQVVVIPLGGREGPPSCMQSVSPCLAP